MQIAFNKLRQNLNLNRIIVLGVSFLLTSCFYSSKHTSSYTVQDKNTNKSTKKITIDYINKLAFKNSLTRDTKYDGVDTLGFYGSPYHYFKLWFEPENNNTIVKLDYWGIFGSRKNQPYKDFFIELNNFMNNNFIILNQNIKEEKNSKIGNN